jgi:hypothetical protein
MNVYTRVANLKLNMYIYRYYLLGGVASFWVVPELFATYQINRRHIRPALNEYIKQRQSGQV